jgi:hypothetical protein
MCACYNWHCTAAWHVMLLDIMQSCALFMLGSMYMCSNDIGHAILLSALGLRILHYGARFTENSAILTNCCS